MCGIYGIYSNGGSPIDLQDVMAATSSMRHRGPDDEGYLLVKRASGECISCGGNDTDRRLSIPRLEEFVEEDCCLALGFRRLSILDLSAAGHQPMSSEDRRYWIVFNGEIYNYLELRDTLTGDGCRFRSNTDTEVVLKAYEKWGVKCLEYFNGMWAFAIWDNREKNLFLARDRFGVKPLFFVSNRRGFIFASEIKAIVGKHGIPFETEDEAVYNYLAKGVLPSQGEEKTFFKGVNILSPGSFIMLEGGRMNRNAYWNLHLDRAAGHEEKSSDEAIIEYRELLHDAVRIRLRSDVPVGTCLSGGLDSTSIACILNRMVTGNPSAYSGVIGRQMTFSAVYDTPDRINEKPYIDEVLQCIRAEGYFTMPGFRDLISDLEKLVWHQDEPFPTTSIFAQWCVMKKVHEQGIKVLLDGQGADETLGGYRPFDVFFAQLLREGKISRLIEEIMSCKTTGSSSLKRFLLRALAWQLPKFILNALGDWQERLNGTDEFLNKNFVSSAGSMAKRHDEEWQERNDLSLHLRRLLQESLLPHLLRFEDRNSMAFSVEARLPFMDYRLVEFAFNQGRNWRMHQGWTKWILRKSMENIVPDSILWRVDKVGFETPEKDWLRQLVTDRSDIFQRRALCSAYLDMPKVEERINGYRRGDTASIDGLWRWINLDVWLKTWTL